MSNNIITNGKTKPCGTSSVYSVQFSIMDGQDAVNDSHVEITEKTLINEGVPVASGLYSQKLGTDKMDYKCTTCFNNKIYCPGHNGHASTNYVLKNPIFAKEIPKWAKIVCHQCSSFVIGTDFIKNKNLPDDKILGEMQTKVRSGDKYKQCIECKAHHPYITKDPLNPNIIIAEYYEKGSKKSARESKILNNDYLYDIFNKITDEQCLLMGKPVISHPRKLLLSHYVVSSVVIRPELKVIGGSRSNMSDTTNSLRSIHKYNSAIPEELPDNIDKTLQKKLNMADLNLFDMIQGTSSTGQTGGLKLSSNTTKMSMSLAHRLPTKKGRIRGNLTAKRTTKIGRSVITGDPSLKIYELGVPEIMCRGVTIKQIVRPWNRNILTRCYENGPDNYPGCTKIKRAIDGKERYINTLDKDYTLQDGDTVFRHVLSGDPCGVSRSPALWWCSISMLKVKVISGLTICMNPIICPLLNADFDGDACNVQFYDNTESTVEANLTSSVYQWFISYQNSSPMLGLFQDSVYGAYEMTHDNINIHPFHAMQMTNRCVDYSKQILIDKKKPINSRKLISKFLPKVNLKMKANFYRKNFEEMKLISYKDTEKTVVIEQGEYIQGIMDKRTIGQGASGGLFHTIHSEYGAAKAIDCMFNLQQLIDGFLYHQSGTFGMGDVLTDAKSAEAIRFEIEQLMITSKKITDQYESGNLIPPAGMTEEEFYESEQIECLVHGDEFISPIIKNIDTVNNNLYKFIYSGSKGKPTNLLSIHGAKGTITVEGARIKENFNGRTSIYFQRGDTHPIARGYDPSNFSRGINPESFLFASMECRGELIVIALGTAIGGTMNRTGTKNLEDIMVSNIMASTKKGRLVQTLSGETGFDMREMEYIKINTITMDDKKLRDSYHIKISDKRIDKKFSNKGVQKMLDDEFKQIKADRDLFRKNVMQLEVENRGTYVISDTIRMPVNVNRILRSVSSLADEKKKPSLNIGDAINAVNEFCYNIPTAMITRRCDHIVSALTYLNINLRANLCIKKLLKYKISDKMLQIVLDRIRVKITNSFIAYGTSLGVLSAQSVSEPMTQYFLNAKHRSGLKKEKTNPAARFEEIIRNKTTEKMENPQMTLMPRLEYRHNKQKVQEIATHIEMLTLSSFIVSEDSFIEKFGKPTYPAYINDTKMIDKFVSNNIIIPPPSDLLDWCIRFKLSSENIILKNMKLRTIYLKLSEQFPNIYIVYDPHIKSEFIVFRIYIRPGHFKKSQIIDDMVIRGCMDDLLSTIVRGVDGITSTAVVELTDTIIDDDGKMSQVPYYSIETDGTNMSAIMENPFFDIYQCYSSSIEEIEYHYGIGAARNKAVSELSSVIKGKTNDEFITVYTDEMTYRQYTTSIQRNGLGKREQNQVFQRASFVWPVQTFRDAAINAQKDPLHGMSAKMLMGTAPRFGTTYNDIGINYNEVKQLSKTTETIIDSL